MNQVSVIPNMWEFNLTTGLTGEIKTDNWQKPKMRKFHSSFLFEDNYMFIIGGMKLNYKFLKDIWVFDIDERVWHEFHFSLYLNPFLEGGIAYHKMALCSNLITFMDEMSDDKVIT